MLGAYGRGWGRGLQVLQSHPMRAGTSERGPRRTNVNNCKPSEERHRIAVSGRACGLACHQICWTFKRSGACGVLRSTVSHIEWLRGEGTFTGFQGISAYSHQKQ